jgi:hypothetical protein
MYTEELEKENALLREQIKLLKELAACQQPSQMSQELAEHYSYPYFHSHPYQTYYDENGEPYSTYKG